MVACVLSATLYQLVMGVRLLRDYADRGTVVFFICCWVALGGSCWVDLLAWAGGPDLLSGGRPACLGLGFFGIFQSMLLGRSHVLSLVDADRLNERLRRQVEDLEARQHEIGSLNEELRRQVGRRTGDILAALMDSERTPVKSLEPGDTIDARYRVVAALGAGGMGAVFEVERLNDGRRFALKMAQEVRGMALARLAREARIATQVHHPNVVSVVDADVAEGGYAYIVMELVEGRTLANLGKERGAAWRLAVLLQVLQGVKALHAQGIIRSRPEAEQHPHLGRRGGTPEGQDHRLRYQPMARERTARRFLLASSATRVASRDQDRNPYQGRGADRGSSPLGGGRADRGRAAIRDPFATREAPRS